MIYAPAHTQHLVEVEEEAEVKFLIERGGYSVATDVSDGVVYNFITGSV